MYCRFRKTKTVVMDLGGSEFSSDRFVKTEFPEATHLDTPLRDTIPRITESYIKAPSPSGSGSEPGVSRAALREVQSLRGFSRTGHYSRDHGKAWSHFYQLAKSFDTPVKAPSLRNWSRVAYKLLQCQKQGIAHLSPQAESLPLPDYPTTLYNLWGVRHVLEIGVRSSSRKKLIRNQRLWELYAPKSSSTLLHHSSLLGKFIVGSFVCIWIPPTSGSPTYILSRDIFLMFSDLISQRFLILLSSVTAPSFQCNDVPSWSVAERVLRWGDRVLELLGNQGYDVLKNWEALCSGIFISEGSEPIVDKHAFLLSTIKELVKIETEYSVDLQVKEIITILRSSVKKNPHHLSQLYGLYRLWGHPIVDLAGGIEKLKSVATGPKIPNLNYIKHMECSFKEQFSVNYWRRHGKWPVFDLTEVPPTSYLYEVLSENRPLVCSHRLYNLGDWDYVKAMKTFEVQDSYSMVDWLSDKAMSLSAEDLKREVEDHGSIGAGWKRSVLYKWLTSDLASPHALLDQIDKNGFPAEETVVGVYDKERELKIMARFFGLLTLWKRMYVVVTESMLAHDILPYFPEITMMDDYTTLQKKLHALTSQTNSSENWEVTYSVDFEKWNSQMREPETIGIFKFLDNLYGYENVISRTHEMFEQSTLYLANGLFLPEFQGKKMKESWASWTGHLGGIEGLRQKGWTLFSLMVLKRVANEVGVKFRLIGQGDNQVFRIQYPKDEGIEQAKKKHQEFIDKLHETLQQIGPPSKKSETWSSSSLFSYGKFLIYEGAPLSMCWKRMCRFMRLGNDGFPSLSSSISSASSNLTAAIASSLSVDHIYFIYLLELLGTLWYNCSYPISQDSILPEGENWTVKGPPDLEQRRDQFRVHLSAADLRKITQLSDGLLGALAMFPLVLGGYPIQLLGTCLMKGFPDPLTESLALLKTTYQYLPDCMKPYIRNILYPHLSKYVNPTQIVQDPVSLNLITESNVGDRVKRFVSDYLGNAQWVTNRKVLIILDAAGRRQDDLACILYQMNPFNPRVGHDVISATLVGRALSIMGRLTKTRTLTALAVQDSSENLYRTLQRAEKSGILAVLGQMHSAGSQVPEGDHLQICTTILADSLRMKGWRKEVSGVTTTSHWEALSCTPLPCTLCPDDDGYVLVRRVEELPWKRIPFDTPGEVPPYMGSATKEKLGSQAIKPEEEGGPLMKNIGKVLRIVNWGVERGSNFHMLLKKILSTLSDHPSEWYETPEESVAGSLEHRWLDEVTKHKGSYAMLFTGPTLYHVSTSSLTKYARGGSNYTIHFQSILLTIVGGLSAKLSQDGDGKNISWHLHIRCPSCIREITEEMLEVPDSYQDITIPSLEGTSEFSSRSSQGQATPVVIALKTAPVTIGGIEWRVAVRLLKETLRLSTEVGDGRGVSPDIAVIPVLWGDKLKLVNLLPKIGILLVIRISLRLPKRVFEDYDTWKAEVISRVINIPAGALAFFGPLLLPVWQRFWIAGAPFQVMTPPTSPPSSAQIGHCLKEGILRAIDLILTGELPFPSEGEEVADSVTGIEALPLFRQTLKLVIESQKSSVLQDFFNLGLLVGEVEFPAQPGTVKTLPLLGNTEGLLNWGFIRHRHTYGDWDLSSEIKKLPALSLGSFTGESPSILLGHKPLTPVFVYHNDNLIKTRTRIYYQTERPFIPGPVSSSNHLLKKLNFHTTAAYKLIQILSSVPLPPANLVAAVGDGSGTFGVILASIFPQAKVYVQSLVDLSNIPPHSLTEASPPAFDPYPSLRKRLIFTRESYEHQSDLTKFATVEAMKGMLGDIDVLTCDAEGSGWAEGKKGLLIAKHLAHLKPGLMIMKSYLSNPKMVLCQVILLLQSYESVRGFRSDWSGINNTEIYIVASGPYPSQSSVDVKDDVILSNFSLTESYQLKLFKGIRNTDWARALKVEDAEQMEKLVKNSAGRVWVKTRLMHYFTKPSYTFPDDVIKEDHQEPWVKGRPAALRTRFRKNVWTHSVRRKCCQRFLIGLAAATWRVTSGYVDLEMWQEKGVFQLWKTRTSWAWVITIKVVEGEKVSDFISKHEVRILYQLAGEAASVIDWKLNPKWSATKWERPHWARPIRSQTSKSETHWEAQGESSSSTATE
ncbi:RNA-dependent RNA polymerase [Wenling crustacean virus 11]|uniref:Replicase n=1 Tax=Wenling crustacean virus 11 TaxID=1923480 RepID=A0A1L3KN96_9RHAB|nr:RNA-dependent RNA polymerase [Wenling crustacean virus 11]APG78836.1 RNA-dependent RNA polymerase [Wenling crustacean virus 11]